MRDESRRRGLRIEEAEAIGVKALGFIATDPVLLRRFLNLSGISADEIRVAARAPGFLAGVLQFIVNHEPTLVAFAEGTGVPAADVMLALRALPGGGE